MGTSRYSPLKFQKKLELPLRFEIKICFNDSVFFLFENPTENKYRKKDHQNIDELQMALKKVKFIMVMAPPKIKF